MENVRNKKWIGVFLASMMCFLFLMMPHFAFADEVNINGKMTITLQETPQETVPVSEETAEQAQDATQAELAQTGDVLGFLVAGIAVLLLGGGYIIVKSRVLQTESEGKILGGNSKKTKHQIICVAVTTALVASTMFGMFLSKRPAIADDAQAQAEVTCLSNVVVDENGKVVSNNIVFKNGTVEDVVLKTISVPEELTSWQANFETMDCVAGAEINGNWVAESVSADVLKQLKETEANSEGVKAITLDFNASYAFKVAFAVYSEDDNSLCFYKREAVPEEGTEFNGIEATYVYTNVENINFYDDEEPEWNCWFTDEQTERNAIRHDVLEVKIVDYNVRPISTDSWFADFRNCTTIDVSKLDCSRNESFSYMFDNCCSLKQIDVRNFDTSNAILLDGMFGSCPSLESIDVSNFNTSKVVDLCGMFHECKSLKTLDISNFDTSKVTDMSFLFAECENLETLDVSNFDTSNVTNMYCMFSECKLLKTLDLSNFNTSKVTNMYSMFSDCNSLTALNISNLDTRNVINMNSMFCRCNSLTSLDISNFDTRNVVNMEGMFIDCSILKSLYFSESFNTSNVTDLSVMFYGCKLLASLKGAENFDTKNVSDMSSTFYDCYSLVLDCSSWDVTKVTKHLFFSDDAPGVIEPNWVS